MREIKFRVWIPDLELMEYCPQIIEEDVGNLNDIFIDDNVVFMQYTGLKDKNGKEIYEGDIVKENNVLYIVCYSDYDASYYAIPYNIKSIDEKCKKYKTPYEAFLNKCHCIDFNNLCCKQVIGNIFENIELLEDKNVE